MRQGIRSGFVGCGGSSLDERSSAIPEGPAGPWTLGPLKAVGELARACSVLLRALQRTMLLRARLTSLLDSAWTACREGRLFHEILERARATSWWDRSTRSSIARGCGTSPRDVCWRGSDSNRCPVLGRVRRGMSVRRAAFAWRAMHPPSWRSVSPRGGRPWACRAAGRRPTSSCRTRSSEARPEGELSVDEGYSVAHAVLFATSFGAEPDGLDEATKDWLRETRLVPAPVPSSTFPNLDVFAEMIFALACTGQTGCRGALGGILRLAQRADGSLPAPAPARPHAPARERNERRRRPDCDLLPPRLPRHTGCDSRVVRPVASFATAG